MNKDSVESCWGGEVSVYDANQCAFTDDRNNVDETTTSPTFEDDGWFSSSESEPFENGPEETSQTEDAKDQTVLYPDLPQLLIP